MPHTGEHGFHHGPGAGPPRLLILGGGGHALVVAEAALLGDTPLDGFLDDNPAAPLSAILIDLPRPFPTPAYLGPLAALDQLDHRHWIVAVGDVRLRRSLLNAVARHGGHAHASRGAGMPGAGGLAKSVIHPTAFVSPSALVGPGTYVGPRAVVHSRARVGAHAIINSGAIVEHDCVIGENVHIAPAAAIGGGVHVGHDTLIGIGARVLPHVAIGHGCAVGAGAVVLRGVGDGATVAGVPAAPVAG